MTTQIELAGMVVDVVKKNIKNIHLSVYPPTGKVRIAAPLHLKLDIIRVFALSKLAWIKKQQAKFASQERETPRDYVHSESHYLWGRRYLLKVEEHRATPSIEKRPRSLLLRIRSGSSRQRALDAFYREELKKAVPALINKWERLMRVTVRAFYVQRMKTKWGSCNVRTGTIRLNTELAKKPRECLEYIVVHEMAHLIEPTHDARFVELMGRFMPYWQHRRDFLNRLPVRHEDWVY